MKPGDGKRGNVWNEGILYTGRDFPSRYVTGALPSQEIDIFSSLPLAKIPSLLASEKFPSLLFLLQNSLFFIQLKSEYPFLPEKSPFLPLKNSLLFSFVLFLQLNFCLFLQQGNSFIIVPFPSSALLYPLDSAIKFPFPPAKFPSLQHYNMTTLLLQHCYSL
jgi:hypothetical protein